MKRNITLSAAATLQLCSKLMLRTATSTNGLPGVPALQTVRELKSAIGKPLREVQPSATKWWNPEIVPKIAPSALGHRGLTGSLAM